MLQDGFEGRKLGSKLNWGQEERGIWPQGYENPRYVSPRVKVTEPNMNVVG